MTKDFESGRGYGRDDWDAVESPPLSRDELAKARPMAEALPNLHARLVAAETEQKTKQISVQLDADVAERLRARGPGWQSRVNEALRRWLDETA